MGQHRQGEGRDGPRRGAVRQGPPAALPPPLVPQDQGPLDQGDVLHGQEHDGVRGARGGDHCDPPHNAVQRKEGRQLLHPTQELLQPYQPEGSRGGAVSHPVSV